MVLWSANLLNYNKHRITLLWTFNIDFNFLCSLWFAVVVVVLPPRLQNQSTAASVHLGTESISSERASAQSNTDRQAHTHTKFNAQCFLVLANSVHSTPAGTVSDSTRGLKKRAQQHIGGGPGGNAGSVRAYARSCANMRVRRLHARPLPSGPAAGVV